MAWCCHVLREIDIKGALNLRLQKEHRLTSPTLHLPRLLQAKTVTKITDAEDGERERERAKPCLNVRTTSISFFLLKMGFRKPLLVSTSHSPTHHVKFI
ncbi:hypothetical protein C1H46_014218 [Malus baccata]|uniref:Uncharacterized protein n=1 Tax=Malus baccata TaxID=106549 RepID=A0A540MN35_MALBA|nr:hypothetical protein C1H46_014218 [Malus baccata]